MVRRFRDLYLNSSLEVPIAYLMPMVATLFFFFKKRKLFNETAAAVVKPAVLIIASVVGVASFTIYIAAETFPIISGVFLGAEACTYAMGSVRLRLVGRRVYGTARLRLRSQGMDIRDIFDEIPPE